LESETRRRLGDCLRPKAAFQEQKTVCFKAVKLATYARSLLEYRINRRYKTRYFAPDIQMREQQLPIQKSENNQPETSGIAHPERQ